MTRRYRPVLLFLLFLPLMLGGSPIAASDTESESSIQALLNEQVAAWNRGDIPSFVNFYASDCTYIGKSVAHGRDEVLANYRKRFDGRSAMGKLKFFNLTVTVLEAHSALAVGHFHLDREASAGGEANGVFSLVLVERNKKWMILLDHTS